MKNTSLIEIFIDSSVNPQLKIGFGAFMIDDKISLKRFENTSSTKLELQTFLWMIQSIDILASKIKVYTDCQNIITLPQREKKLKQSAFKSSTNKELKNKALYEEFFLLLEKFDIEFIKVKGHKQKAKKDEIDRLFSKVDKASRQALRTYIKDTKQYEKNI